MCVCYNSEFKLFCFFVYCYLEHDVREKPSVLVTSPGSPEFNYLYKSHHQSTKRGTVNRFQGRSSSSITHESVISGRIQIKLGFEASTLQLILTVVCAADLTYCSNGATRNSYAKVRISDSYTYLLT